MLREMLRGFEARQPQTVGNMCVIPLVGQETEYNDIGTVEDVYLNRDLAYDRLQMGTNSQHTTIVPGGYTLLTKEAAQDRAVRSKELITAGGTRQVDAFCVQSSQGGFMRGNDTEQQKVRMLPATIRRAAYTHRNDRGYSSLWEHLSTYNASQGLSGDFLKSFFDKYKQQMSEFVAEFELVPHQRGAIILINEKILGIEISANPMAFSAQWELLIRDCYGSEAVARQTEAQTVDETAIFKNTDTLEDLSGLLDKFEDDEWDYVEKLVNSVFLQNETCQERQTEGGLKVDDIETEDYVGQLVRENGTVIDMTLLAREAAEKGFRFDRPSRRRR